jgi:multiple antibiotic resistance protein
MTGPGAIFTLFLVTLGPVKLLGPFAQQTRDLDTAALRRIAVRVFAVGLVAVIAGGYVGTALAAKWQVSVPAIEIATGLILLLVAIRLVMSAYEPPHALTQPPLSPEPTGRVLRLTFPLVVTPYGIAAVIALLASNDDPSMITGIYVVLILVMVLNLLVMLFIREIMRGQIIHPRAARSACAIELGMRGRVHPSPP